MTVKYYCDRCGIELKKYESVRKPLGGGEYSDWLFFCKSCFKIYLNVFREFMKK